MNESKHRIEFNNGNIIESSISQNSNNIIRGKRSRLPIHYDVVEMCLSYIAQEELDKILEPYINKKG